MNTTTISDFLVVFFGSKHQTQQHECNHKSPYRYDIDTDRIINDKLQKLAYILEIYSIDRAYHYFKWEYSK